MSLWDVPETAELDEVIRLGRELDGDLAALRTLRAEADHLAAESSERTRNVARRLAKAGVGLRDVGELLGVSFQRAAQLIK